MPYRNIVFHVGAPPKHTPGPAPATPQWLGQSQIIYPPGLDILDWDYYGPIPVRPAPYLCAASWNARIVIL